MHMCVTTIIYTAIMVLPVSDLPLVNSTNLVTAMNWSTWMTNKGGYEK